jgi:multidrug resistance efflux pump
MVIKPSLLARYGTFLICLILLVVLLFSWFVKYPETIITSAKLSGENAPKPLVVYQSGKLLHLLKNNGDKVQQGEIIGCLETTSDWQEVLKLSSAIDTLYGAIKDNDKSTIQRIMSYSFSHLGELQSDYQSFTQAYIPYRDFVLGSYANRKRALVQKDISYIKESNSVLAQQAKLYSEDIALSQTNLENNKELLKDNVISEQEYRELTSQNINKKMAVPQMQANYINSASQSNAKQKELLELDNQIRTNEATFNEAVYSFKSRIDIWKRDYLLIASISGLLSFTRFVQENQVVEAGSQIAYINPPNKEYYLQMLIPQNNLGKVDLGQRVFLKFDAWQWQEYGTVIGVVDYMSNVATDSGYLAKITLPNGLTTNRGKVLGYKEGLIAQAEIITKDMRLSERFYYDLVKLIRRD